MSKLTARACEGAKPHSDRDRLLGDGDGLFLRIRPHGTKTWIVEYEFRGSRRKPTIGVFDSSGAPGESITAWLDYGRLSLSQARSIAAQWKLDRRGGRDPAAEWESRLSRERAEEEAVRVAAAVEAQQPTVRQVVQQFTTKHICGKKSANAVCYRLDCLVNHLGDRKIRDVSRQEAIAAFEQIGKGRVHGKTAKQFAGEVLTLAKRLWRFAETREWVAASCIAPLTRKDFDARPNKRDVTLRMDELAELWRALGDPNRCKADNITIAALRLMILTGQREREVTDAEWSEFDLDAGLWKIPASRTKRGRAHLVHIAPQAAAILTQLKPITGKERHVFASPLRKDQAIYGRSVNNALQTMFKRGGLPNVTHCHVHDLRRTLITRLPDLGFEPFIGHKIANHVLPGVLAHYNHAEYLPQREAALKAWAERIDALAADKKIVQLQRIA
ncbi:MAG TPA: integrase arm-type DNA-binding domain-containing protein [Casimicrobiaceae bacterium]|nr:integrase arm-type DNA-binding domain-containing protein [Casimicrobiaceae bacterium]